MSFNNYKINKIVWKNFHDFTRKPLKKNLNKFCPNDSFDTFITYKSFFLALISILFSKRNLNIKRRKRKISKQTANRL